MKQKKTAEAGNTGEGIRSDCRILLELRSNGGIEIELNSKVKSLYGKSIEKLCREGLNFFAIQHARLVVDDSGALPFVIMARLEAAVKQCINTDKEYLPKIIPENRNVTVKEHFRFSRLYLPGNSPKLMINAGVHKPNAIILDLEDSVAPTKKMEARYLVRNALRQVNFHGAERMVRINQIPEGLDDLKFIIPHNVQVILIPKCEDAQQIRDLEMEIDVIKKVAKQDNKIFLMPILENALGIEKAYEIASSSNNLVAMAIGLEDYTADLGTRRTREGLESFFARTRLINACKAAGIQPIDSVYSDVGDMQGLHDHVRVSKSLGFEGMGVIHPRQIKVIHEGFAPDEEEIDKAKKVVNAFIEAKEKGLGVVALGTKMIDPPVVKRAERTIDLALKLGLIGEDWRKDVP